MMLVLLAIGAFAETKMHLGAHGPAHKNEIVEKILLRSQFHASTQTLALPDLRCRSNGSFVDR
jgi:hypothetical protein